MKDHINDILKRIFLWGMLGGMLWWVIAGVVGFAFILLGGCEGNRVPLNRITDTYKANIDPNSPINTHLLKVSDSWAKEYGTSHESVLKYNTVAAWAFAQRALQQIQALNKRVKAMEVPVPTTIKALKPEVLDPNEIVGENWMGMPIRRKDAYRRTLADPNEVKE